MEKMKDEVIASGDSKMLESYSAHTKSTTSALETLLKFKNAEDKIKAQKEIAQMNIDAKVTKNEEDENTPKLTFTRNDILKLLEKKKDDDDDPPLFLLLLMSRFRIVLLRYSIDIPCSSQDSPP
jgi:hypothetical protein